MSAGLPKFVVVNLDDLEKAFDANAEVDIAAIEEKGLLNISGRDAKLGLKVRARGAAAAPAAAARAERKEPGRGGAWRSE